MGVGGHSSVLEHLMSLGSALKDLEEEGKAQPWSPGLREDIV